MGLHGFHVRILGSYHMPGLILHSNVHLKLVFRKEKVSEFAKSLIMY